MTAAGAKRHDATGRSSGKRKTNRRTKIGGAFAPRTIEMLVSPAYRQLSLSAHRVLSRIEVELAAHGGADNGRLPVPYDHFCEYGVHRHAINPAIRELEALGFIKVRRGRAGNADYRHPNEFRLTYRASDQSEPTNEWQRITSEKEAKTRAEAARKNRSPVPVSANVQ